MKYLFSTLAFIALLTVANGQDDGLAKLIKPGAALEKLAGDLMFTEGPTPDPKGNIYFTDQPNDRIVKWSDAEGLTTFMQPAGRANGMAMDKKGYIWACTEAQNEIWKIAPDKSYTVVVPNYEGKHFNGPNDVWIAANGGMYITDPYFRRDWYKHEPTPQGKQCVYYLSPDGKSIRRVVEDMQQPNGIVGSVDGKRLFIADMRGNKTYVYDIAPDGSLLNKTLFCEMGSDGMTIDTKGNIYMTGRGVTVFDSTGKKIGNIAVPESWTANVCFGGKDFKSLYITASKGLYRMKMNVKGTKY